jgi:hypothetical protein
MPINKHYVKLLLIPFVFGLLFLSNTRISHASNLEYDGLEFIAEDQVIVDDQVMVKVNIHHPGFVVIYNQTGDIQGHMLGHSYTEEMVRGHDHNNLDIKLKTQIASNGEDHTSYVRIHLAKTGRTESLYARLFNDTNMNMQFEMNGSDQIYKDASGTEVVESFTVLSTHQTTIEVHDQNIKLSDAQVFVNKVIVPGPAWLVIHLNDNGTLGPMLGRRFIPLNQGINSDLYVDINANKNIRNGSFELAVFAHLHWDNKDYGIFNHSTDTHVFSPAFDDPILGSDSAEPFTIHFEEDSTTQSVNFLGQGLIVVSLSCGVLIFKKRD